MGHLSSEGWRPKTTRRRGQSITRRVWWEQSEFFAIQSNKDRVESSCWSRIWGKLVAPPAQAAKSW